MNVVTFKIGNTSIPAKKKQLNSKLMKNEMKKTYLFYCNFRFLNPKKGQWRTTVSISLCLSWWQSNTCDMYMVLTEDISYQSNILLVIWMNLKCLKEPHWSLKEPFKSQGCCNESNYFLVCKIKVSSFKVHIPWFLVLLSNVWNFVNTQK